MLAGDQPGLDSHVPGLHRRSIAPPGRARARRARTAPPSPRKRSTISTGFRPPARAFSWRPCSRPSGCGSAPRASWTSSCTHALATCAGRWSRSPACWPWPTSPSTAAATPRWAGLHPSTGWLYPFFAPLLGWLGVALTGSDTSSNALFGSLQRITAEQLRPQPGPDRRLQQHRRRDGQDDRRPEHRRGRRGHRANRPRRQILRFVLLAQHRHGA